MVVKIIGKGAWGNSIAQPLRDNGHTVVFLGRGEVHLSDNDIVVLALPTNAIREALAEATIVKDLQIINCSKGVERSTHKLPYEIVHELLDSTTKYYALLGPSFAHELQEKMPTLVNLGFTGTADQVHVIEKLFETKYLRIHTVNHVASLELAGAMKNIYAIACGIADGIGFGMNTRIKLIITAIEEYYVLCKGLDFPLDERAIGGVIGDFMLTGSSNASRNFQFGRLLVHNPIEEALLKVGATVEGHASVYSLEHLVKKANVQAPLAEMVMGVVTGKKKEHIKEQFLAFAQQV